MSLDRAARPPSLSPLSWSAPRLDGGDFAPEDPLAIDHLHQQLGNQLWPGFTTRTGRAFYYVVVSYGLRLVDELLLQHGVAANDENRRSWFERWERLWALAVCAWYNGNIPNVDAMRGKNGVVRTWRSAAGRRPLDYPLISRQLELGALGAYRSSLVDHGLLSAEALRPTPIGAELAGLMWVGEDRAWELDAYARACLAPGNVEAPEQVGWTTLRSFGQRCRLSGVRERPQVQARLNHALFEDHPPPPRLAVLPEMARHLAASHGAGVRDPRAFLDGLVRGRWGEPSPEVALNARVALVFGDLASALRAAFDRAYQAVLDGGYQAGIADVAQAALPRPDTAAHLDACLRAWHDLPEAARRVRDEAHGGPFAGAVAALDAARPAELVGHLLALHRQVQIARGKSGAWLSLDGERVLMDAGGYRSWSLDGTKWVVRFKFDSMSELLRDLGKVP